MNIKKIFSDELAIPEEYGEEIQLEEARAARRHVQRHMWHWALALP